MNVEISPSDKSLIDLASITYEESELLEIVKFKGSISALNIKYDIECLREDASVYRVSYLGIGKIAVLIFNHSGERLSGYIYNTQLLKSDYVELAKGQSLEKVRAVDPNGEYLFLSTGRDDFPKVSNHYTKDGYLITIEYDESNIIVNISEEFI